LSPAEGALATDLLLLQALLLLGRLQTRRSSFPVGLAALLHADELLHAARHRAIILDTFAVRGILPNADRVLLPGYYVRVRVPVDQEQAALLVPDVALGSDQAGRYLLVVNSDNVVEQRKVRTGPLEGDLRVIESGLMPDDRVVIAGLLRAIPGQKVEPQLQKIEAPPASAK